MTATAKKSGHLRFEFGNGKATLDVNMGQGAIVDALTGIAKLLHPEHQAELLIQLLMPDHLLPERVQDIIRSGNLGREAIEAQA